MLYYRNEVYDLYAKWKLERKELNESTDHIEYYLYKVMSVVIREHDFVKAILPSN